MFTVVSSIIAPNWKQPISPSTGEWINNCGTSIQWNTTQQGKGPNSWMTLKCII